MPVSELGGVVGKGSSSFKKIFWGAIAPFAPLSTLLEVGDYLSESALAFDLRRHLAEKSA